MEPEPEMEQEPLWQENTYRVTVVNPPADMQNLEFDLTADHDSTAAVVRALIAERLEDLRFRERLAPRLRLYVRDVEVNMMFIIPDGAAISVMIVGHDSIEFVQGWPEDDQLRRMFMEMAERDFVGDPDTTWADTPEYAEAVRLVHSLQTGAQAMRSDSRVEVEWRKEIARVLREAVSAPDASPSTTIEHLKARMLPFLQAPTYTVRVTNPPVDLQNPEFELGGVHHDSTAAVVRARIASRLAAELPKEGESLASRLRLYVHGVEVNAMAAIPDGATIRVEIVHHSWISLVHGWAEDDLLTQVVMDLARRRFAGAPPDNPDMQWADTPEFAELVRIAHSLQTGAQVRGSAGGDEVEWRNEIAQVLQEAASAPGTTPGIVVRHLMAEFD